MEMHEFQITAKGRTETFRIGNDYGPGEVRHHWTLSGLEKLIRLGLWKRELDKQARVKAKPPTVETIMKLAKNQRLMSA
jgi:hypothetical protein